MSLSQNVHTLTHTHTHSGTLMSPSYDCCHALLFPIIQKTTAHFRCKRCITSLTRPADTVSATINTVRTGVHRKVVIQNLHVWSADPFQENKEKTKENYLRYTFTDPSPLHHAKDKQYISLFSSVLPLRVYSYVFQIFVYSPTALTRLFHSDTTLQAEPSDKTEHTWCSGYEELYQVLTIKCWWRIRGGTTKHFASYRIPQLHQHVSTTPRTSRYKRRLRANSRPTGIASCFNPSWCAQRMCAGMHPVPVACAQVNRWWVLFEPNHNHTFSHKTV